MLRSSIKFWSPLKPLKVSEFGSGSARCGNGVAQCGNGLAQRETASVHSTGTLQHTTRKRFGILREMRKRRRVAGGLARKRRGTQHHRHSSAGTVRHSAGTVQQVRERFVTARERFGTQRGNGLAHRGK
jgi:hypothetical protein